MKHKLTTVQSCTLIEFEIQQAVGIVYLHIPIYRISFFSLRLEKKKKKKTYIRQVDAFEV